MRVTVAKLYGTWKPDHFKRWCKKNFPDHDWEELYREAGGKLKKGQ